MKYDKETDEEGKKRRVSMEKSKAATKKISPGGLTEARAHRPPGVVTPPSSGWIT